MNINFTVRFRGFPASAAAALEKMLRDDIARYPDRLSMETATVEIEKAKKNAKS